MAKVKPVMVRVKALAPHSYAGVRYERDDVYEAVKAEADKMVKGGWVNKGVPPDAPVSQGRPESPVPWDRRPGGGRRDD